MKVADCNWMQVEEYLEHDDRAVLPVGSTEQHAYLSLATDSILAERVASRRALGVLLSRGDGSGSPWFTAFRDRCRFGRHWSQSSRLGALRSAGVPALPVVNGRW